jgi:iron complex transport system ATP-binding protein
VTAGAAIRAHDLIAGYRKGRRHLPVVEVTELAAPAGHLTAVIGPNGGGKSTLLRTLVGTQPPLHGTVFLDDVPLAQLDRIDRARRIAVVLTDRIEPGLLTVADVVLLGRHPHTDWRGHLTADDKHVARDAAGRLGVEHLWHQPFAELSDGQRQRVLVARALAQQPDVLVLDEPTAFLDVAGRIELTLAAAALARDGLAVIVATHDLELALSHADRVWLVADAAVHDSSPEQLVATGELTRAFSDDIVEVDTTTGTIRARLRGGQPIVVHGADLDAQLVKRMVTRLGAIVVDGPGDDDAWQISRTDSGWIIHTSTETHVADAYDTLAGTLRRLLHIVPAPQVTR